ncbi:MAG: hypothetical protein ACFCVK_06485 [Acidimicrobiales bacterium]
MRLRLLAEKATAAVDGVAALLEEYRDIHRGPDITTIADGGAALVNRAWGWVTVGADERELTSVVAGDSVAIEGWTMPVGKVGGGAAFFVVVDPDGRARVG